MTITTRIAVFTLTVGFLIEGVGEVFEFVSKQWLLSHLPSAMLDVYYIGPATTVLGFLFAFMGRHEWSELHRRHVLHGHKFLALAIVLLGSVVAIIGLLAFQYPDVVVPTLLPWVLGALTMAGLASSFVSYMLIGFHITTPRGKACLGISVVWGFAVSLLVGYYVASDLPQILLALRTHSTGILSQLSGLTAATTFLFVSYFLLVFAYHDAYRQLLRGILPEGHTPAKAYRPPPKPAVASAPPSA